MKNVFLNIIGFRNIFKFPTFHFSRAFLLVAFLLIIPCSITPSPVDAAVNLKINYQGKLTDTSNVAVADGNYIMQFRLYTSPTAATTTAIWEEIRTAAGDRAAVTNGLFSVLLGSSTPLTDVNFNQTLYLGVEVCGTSSLSGCDGEMTPRKELGAVPAAVVSTYVSGSSTPSSFGTTTPIANSVLTVEATTTTAVPITVRAAASQSANLFQVQNAAASNLLFVNSAGGLFASSTLQVTGATTLYSDLTVSGSLLVSNATSTITNLTMVNATSTNATTTNLYLSGRLNLGGVSVWDSSNNRLGIGTTSPYAPLSVVGEAVAQYFTATSTTATSTLSGGLVVGTNKLVTDLSTGFTGLGTVSPVAKLQVVATGSTVPTLNGDEIALFQRNQAGAADAAIAVISGRESMSKLYLADSTDIDEGYMIYRHSDTASNIYLSFGVNNSEAARFNYVGNLGIGTTTPSDLLTVSGGDILQIPENPTQATSISIGTNPTDVAVQGKFIYVVEDGTNDDLRIIEYSTTSPSLIGTLALGTGVKKIAVSGRYAYVADAGTDDLRVVDISNPTAPATVGTLTLATISSTALTVSGRYAYVIDNSGVSGALRIIDVSNATAPQLVSATALLATGTMGNIIVRGRYAYLTVNDNSNNYLIIMDISNPAAPVAVGSMTTTSSLGGEVNYTKIDLAGRYVYWVDNYNNWINVINVANPAAPVSIATLTIGGLPNDLAVAGRYAYVVDSNSNDLKVIDVVNPAAPVSIGSLALGTGFKEMAVAGRYAYVVDDVSVDLKIIDLSGAEFTTAVAHSLEAGNLQVVGNAVINSNLAVVGGLNVGTGGIFSVGPIAVGIASSTQSNAPSAYFVGNVGIGTTTPYAPLSVVGQTVSTYFTATSTSATSTFQGTILAASGGSVGIGTTTPGAKLNIIGALCVDDTSPTCGNAARTDGTVYAVNAFSQSLDLAESYPTKESTLTAGEIVSLDPANPVFVTRATAADSLPVLGAVSTKPGFYLGGFADELYPDDKKVPVALSGRVPVKVNLEGGVIEIGDRITVSSVAGIGRKATSTEPSIGFALESFSGSGTGLIQTFINLRYPEIAPLAVQGQALPSDDSLQGNPYDNLVAETLTVAGDVEFRGQVVVLGDAEFRGRVTVKELKAEKICLGQTCFDEEQLKTILEKVNLTPSSPSLSEQLPAPVDQTTTDSTSTPPVTDDGVGDEINGTTTVEFIPLEQSEPENSDSTAATSTEETNDEESPSESSSSSPPSDGDDSSDESSAADSPAAESPAESAAESTL